MGRDKATIVVGGASLAERTASVLRAVAAPVLAVGPESGSGLPAVEDPKMGPLVALDRGLRALVERGHTGPAFVLACDMPMITAEMLVALASLRRGADAAIPIAGGRLQPMCSVLGVQGRAAVSRAVAHGARSMQEAMAAMKIEVVPAEALGDPAAFVDLDTPQDLARAAADLEAPA